MRVPALDDLLPNVNANLIKIDIEGSELGALRGGEMLIKRSKTVIIIQCVLRGTNALGYAVSLLWQWIASRGFRIFPPDRQAHTAPGLSHEAFIDAQEYPLRSHNCFAVHESRIDDVRERYNRHALVAGLPAVILLEWQGADQRQDEGHAYDVSRGIGDENGAPVVSCSGLHSAVLNGPKASRLRFKGNATTRLPILRHVTTSRGMGRCRVSVRSVCSDARGVSSLVSIKISGH